MFVLRFDKRSVDDKKREKIKVIVILSKWQVNWYDLNAHQYKSDHAYKALIESADIWHTSHQ